MRQLVAMPQRGVPVAFEGVVESVRASIQQVIPRSRVTHLAEWLEAFCACQACFSSSYNI